MAEADDLLEVKERLALVEARLQQLFDHLDIAPRQSAGPGGGGWGDSSERGASVDAASDPEIQDLIAKGNKMQAIKRYHELTGLGLQEAEKAIEAAGG